MLHIDKTEIQFVLIFCLDKILNMYFTKMYLSLTHLIAVEIFLNFNLEIFKAANEKFEL